MAGTKFDKIDLKILKTILQLIYPYGYTEKLGWSYSWFLLV